MEQVRTILELEQTTLDSELQNYLKAVEGLAEAKSDYIFKNSSHKHAAVVMSVMLKNCKNEFRIYDDNLSGDIGDQYEGFYPALEEFVRSGKTLKVIIDNHNQEDSNSYKLLKKLFNNFPQKVSVKRSNEHFKKAITNNYKILLNFAVGDSQMFRLEESDRSKNDSNRRAFCCFNNSAISGSLKNSFDQEFENCKNVF